MKMYNMHIVLNPDELMNFSKHQLVSMLVEREQELLKYKTSMLTKEQAAEELGCSVGKINKMISDGRLKFKKERPDIQQSPVKIPFSAIMEYKNAN